MLSDQLFLRYQRQVCLPDIGIQGQSNLMDSHVLVIGCGGLGSAATLYLAAAGVGRMVLVDDDVLEVSNLQRQIAYRESDLMQKKASALALELGNLNANVAVRILDKRLNDDQLSLEVMLADVVLDCSDNLETRQQINRICYLHKTALISAASIGWKGQFTVFDYAPNTPCYRCLIPFDEMKIETKCSEQGVVGPVVGTLGNYQALATIQKLTTGRFLVKSNQLHLFDGQTMQWQIINITRDSECKVCTSAIEVTEGAS